MQQPVGLHVSKEYTDLSRYSEMNDEKRAELYRNYRQAYNIWQKEVQNGTKLHHRTDWVKETEDTYHKVTGLAEIIKSGKYNDEDLLKTVNNKKTPDSVKKTIQNYFKNQTLAQLMESDISAETAAKIKGDKTADKKIREYVTEYEQQSDEGSKANFKAFVTDKAALSDSDLKSLNFAKNKDFKNYVLNLNPENNGYEIELLKNYTENNNKKALQNTIYKDNDRIIADEIGNIEIAADKTNDIQDGKIGSFSQGTVGDCWFLGTIDSIAQSKKGAKIIENAIKKTDNGYTVTFPIDGKQISVSEEEVKEGIMKDLNGNPFMGNSDEPQYFSSGDKDVRILEIAANRYYLEHDNVNLNGGKDKVRRYTVDDLFKITSNKDLEVIKDTEKTHESLSAVRKKLGKIYNTPKNDEKLAALLEKHTSPQLTCSTYPSDEITTEEQIKYIKRFHTNHLYNIISYDTDKKTIKLANPYDNAHPITASFEEFKSIFKEIYVIKEL